ncbi:MAG: D-alanine--D-alanine ligase [Hyphomicrobiales bacterium]|nr:D-alanine--D-alanine ligase [Hyphomicrobiales bacterium]MCY4052394.1 D-alanine--D-alanine ligase [Hyphomicrobiales bacterium]
MNAIQTRIDAGEKLHVAVLMGGWSGERDISLMSGRGCADALRREGFKVSEVDVDHSVASKLETLKPDVAFNALHGAGGEDGCIQGVLETLEIPYTHSGVLASALAMNKEISKRLFSAHGLPVAQDRIVARTRAAAEHALEPPYVIKPLCEGSSLGVFLVLDEDAPPPPELLNDAWEFGERIMVERFIPGRELTCCVMGDKALDVIDIVTDGGFYDFQNKYTPGGSQHILPADVPGDVYRRTQEISLHAHRVLGCRGVSRADFRFDEALGVDGIILLEVNTQPGMTETSLIPDMANHIGIPYDKLVKWIAQDASCWR